MRHSGSNNADGSLEFSRKRFNYSPEKLGTFTEDQKSERYKENKVQNKAEKRM